VPRRPSATASAAAAAAAAGGLAGSSSPASRALGLGQSNTSNSSGPLAGVKEPAAAAAAAAAEGPLLSTAAVMPPAWPLPESQPGDYLLMSPCHYVSVIVIV
jgi:hypothetical protein